MLGIYDVKVVVVVLVLLYWKCFHFQMLTYEYGVAGQKIVGYTTVVMVVADSAVAIIFGANLHSKMLINVVIVQ